MGTLRLLAESIKGPAFTVLVVLAFFLPAFVATAQTDPPPTPRFPIPGRPAGHENPVGQPRTDDEGRTCQTYRASGFAGGQFVECRDPDNGEVESCETQAFPGPEGTIGSIITSCETFDSEGNLIRINDRAVGPVIGVNEDRETDPVTGETEVTVTNTRASEGCGMMAFGCWIGKLPGMLFAGVALLLLMLAGGILFIAGTVFNWVVIRTVFEFGNYFGASAGMLIAWGVMRDIANIALLFGFIFMGVALILNMDGGGHGHGHGGGMNPRRAIPRLIIFAVLLNFSLFASQVVIDVANAFSAQFAVLAGTQCETDVTTEGDTDGQSAEQCAEVGISGQILAAAGVTKVLSIENMGTAFDNLVDRPYSYTVSLIMLTIFVLVTAMVLFAGAIMLVIRVVVLSFLMVTSPIGFAGMAIPPLQKIANDWWSKLLSQAFFAPVYLLLIFISIKLTEGLMQGEATLANAIIANEGQAIAGNMQVVMVFMIVIGFMIGSLLAANKMGAMGAQFAMNTGAAVTFGSMSRLTNLGVGGAASLARQRIQSSRFKDSKIAQVAVNRGLRPLEKANLDFRRLPGAAAGLGAAGVTAGAKPAEHATFREMKHEYEDFRDGKQGKKLQAEYEREQKDQALEDDIHNSPDGLLTEDNKKFLQSLSTKELEGLHGIKDGLDAIAQNLKQEQYDALQKSDALTDDEKRKLKDARDRRFDNTSVPGAPLPGGAAGPVPPRSRAQRTLHGMRPEEVASLSASTLTKPEVLAGMTAAQLAAVDPSKLSADDLDKFHTHMRAAAGTAQMRQFRALVGAPGPRGGAPVGAANPLAQRRWTGYLP